MWNTSDRLYAQVKATIVSKVRSTANHSLDGIVIFRPLARDFGLDLDTYGQMLAELKSEKLITIDVAGNLTAILTPHEHAIIVRDLRINELERQLAACTNQDAPADSHVYANGTVADANGKVWYKIADDGIGLLLASYMNSIAELSTALLRFSAENDALKTENARLANPSPPGD